MQHLATHTSGLPRLPHSLGFQLSTGASGLTGGNPYGGITAEKMHEYLAGTKRLQGNGERWAYSNFGSGILGMSVSKRRNQSYEEVLQESIAAPLGMENTSTYFEQNGTRYADGFPAYLSFGRMHIAVGSSPWIMAEGLVGAGGIRSTGADMLRFLEALVYNELPFAASSTDLLFPVDDSWGMGTKWIIDRLDNDNKIIWHNGQTGGFNSYIGFHSHANIGVFALSNSHIDVQRLAESLLDYAYQKNR